MADFHQWLTLLFASIIFILALNLVFRRKTKLNNLPPGPPKLPVIGNLHQLGSIPHISLTNLAKKYGPIIFLQLGHVPTVVVSSAKLAKELMKTHDLALSNRPQLFSAKHLFYNCTDIVYSPYGAYWRFLRKICLLHLFGVKQVLAYSYVREQEVSRLINRVRDSICRPDGAIDLSELLGMYANDVICRVALGREFSGGGEYNKHAFQKLLEDYQELLGGFSLGDFFPSLEFLFSLTGMKSRLVKTSRGFDEIFEGVIEEHRNFDGAKDVKNYDLVDVLLEIQKDQSAEIRLTMDKAIILDMFAAGTDTTFIVLDWGITELVTNPQVMRKAQAEIRSIMGDQKVVLETDLPKFDYLKAVIKEIYRLHPPAPVLVPRESKEEVAIDGYKLPAGTRFWVNAWAMGRDPEVWENLERFDPDRFMGSLIDFRGQDFELIPFGAGRRICPGMTFAIPAVELALAQLLHSFDWELPPAVEAKDLDMTEVFGITMHRKAHLLVVAKPHFAV